MKSLKPCIFHNFQCRFFDNYNLSNSVHQCFYTLKSIFPRLPVLLFPQLYSGLSPGYSSPSPVNKGKIYPLSATAVFIHASYFFDSIPVLFSSLSSTSHIVLGSSPCLQPHFSYTASYFFDNVPALKSARSLFRKVSSLVARIASSLLPFVRR